MDNTTQLFIALTIMLAPLVITSVWIIVDEIIDIIKEK